jgi:drug/metabolite transporter (DMT)-like permease
LPDAAAVRSVRGWLLGLMAVWGLNVSMMKALSTQFEPSIVALLRMATATLALTAIALWRLGALPRYTRRQAALLAACGALMIAANQWFVSRGMQLSSATHAALIFALSPTAASLLGLVALRDRPSPRQWAGLALGFAGVAAVVGSRQSFAFSSAGFGDLLLLGSVLTWAGGGLLVQRLARELGALEIAWGIYVVGAALLAVAALAGPTPLDAATLFPSWTAWALIVLSGVGSTALGGLVWNRGIATLGAAGASTFQYWMPIFGLGFGALLLGEPLDARHALGLALVLGGTWLGMRR